MKGSLRGKMPGDDWRQLAGGRGFYAYMLCHPGKKLLFMGSELPQWHEWDFRGQLDWYLQYDPKHRQLHSLFRDLLSIYKKYSCMYMDNRPFSGFEWINSTDNKRSIFSFIRTAPKSGTNLLFILNFTPVAYPEYAVGVPKKGKYTLLLDETRGMITHAEESDIITTTKEICDGKPYRIQYSLPAYGIAIFKY